MTFVVELEEWNGGDSINYILNLKFLEDSLLLIIQYFVVHSRFVEVISTLPFVFLHNQP